MTPRERILAAAYDLFSHRGIRAVGVNELIKHADVAKATFYRHYHSKDARDVFRFPAGAVVIKRHPPAETYVLYARDGRTVLTLVGDPAGHVKLSRITQR